MTDYEAKVEAASKEFQADDTRIKRGPANSFRQGARWCRKNPPPEVMALVEAHRELLLDRKQEFHDRVCLQTRGCHCKDSWLTDKALAAFEKEIKSGP